MAIDIADPRVWGRARKLELIHCRRFAKSHLPVVGIDGERKKV
jgi:hypothetical protein